ncbi:hypothetical protein [Mitsuokella jalaludinii]|uniref:hypothetical protein n=1 Tax=Mitsuokella jalaludinii TaxID=187979 RepID=UPI003F99A5AB
MKDQNRRQRHHIRAARDWLGKAEHSLEEDNEVRGELKVMLAKAELAQARPEAESGILHRWGRRLLPAAAALLIAGGGWLGIRLVQTSVSPPLAAPATETTDAAALDRESAAPSSEDSSVPTTAGVLPEVPQEAPVRAAEPVEHSAPPPSHTAEQPAAGQPAAPAAASQKAPQVPDDDMQKLMQTAGKALRR